MAITRLGGANAITGTLPAANINNTSIGNITALPTAISTGKVLQVVRTYATNPNSHIETTSTTLTSSGITATITPTASGNLILVDFSSAMTDQTSSGHVGLGRMKVKVGSGSFTDMSGATPYHIGYIQNNENRNANLTFGGSYTTTSTDTLVFQPYIRASSGTFRLVHDNSSYALTLTEVEQ